MANINSVFKFLPLKNYTGMNGQQLIISDFGR